MAYVSLGADPFREDAKREARRRQARLEATAPTVEGDMSELTRLQARGWKLGADDDIEAIEGHIARVVDVYKPIEFGSELSDLIHEASTAVESERARRNLEHDLAVARQRDRIRCIRLAATRIEDATKQLEAADGIEDRRAELLPRACIGAIDAERMDDAELDRAIQARERDAASRESSAKDWARVAELLLTVKGDAFRRHAKTAKAMATEYAEDAEAYRASAQAARAELESRAASEPDDVDALRKRVAELEKIVAGSAKQATG